MRLSSLLPAVFAVSCVHATGTDSLTDFLEAHPKIKPTASDSIGLVNGKLTSNSTAANFVPNGYIIELRPGSGLTKRGRDSHSQFHKRASSTINYSTRQEFKNSDVFFGLSIQVRGEVNESTIRQLPDVLKVWPITVIPPPDVGRTPVRRPAAVAKEGPFSPKAGTRANTNSIHKQTEVDRLHALGIKGKGIKIAVMDTGVDYRHEALGAGFGEGFKIGFGKDLIGDYYDETGFPEPDDDPFDTCYGAGGSGHGTHVIGTIGMQDKADSPFGLVGVAPEATLGVYRVFSCNGGAPLDVMIAAFEQALVDKVDVLSISIAAGLSWESYDPFQLIAAKLEAQGIAVVAANGNTGTSGPGNAVTPAISKGSIAVGSVQNSHFPVIYGLKDSRGRSLKYSGDPWPIFAPTTGLTVYDYAKFQNPAMGGFCDNEAWSAASNAIPDKENSLIAIGYHEFCSYDTNVAQAIGFGFKYFLSYTLPKTDVFDQDYTTAYTLNQVDSSTLLGGLAASKKNTYKIFVTSNEFESLPLVSGGLMSEFSTWGPTFDALSIKPQISAPGGTILSTWPLDATGYAIISGTSMATPYVSGAYALLKSQFPDATVQQLRERLQSTAKSVPYTYDRSIRAPIGQQGGGIINVYNAIFFESAVSPSELNLGDTDQLKPREIVIENKTGRSKTYVITHEPAGGYNLQPTLYGPVPGPEENHKPGAYASYAGVKFSSTSILVKGGEKATFVVTFDPPQDFDDAFLPVYTGFIKITNNNDVFRVAYLGQPYSRNKAKYIDTGTFSGLKLPIIQVINSQDTLDVVTDIVETDFGENERQISLVIFDWAVHQSITYSRIDMVPYNTSFVPTYYGFNFSDSNPYGVPASALPLVYPDLKFNGTKAGAETYGLWSSVEYSNPPNGYWGTLSGEIRGDFGVPVGLWPDADYRALLRVLKWGGDRDVEEDYESWLSPVIRTKRNVPS